EVADLPEIRASASPALDVKANAERVHMTGRLLVPKADITLKQLPASAVRVSDDVVLIGRSGEERKPRQQVRTYATVQLQLGDAVTFSGFGANAQLRGDLLLTNSPDNGARARGEVDVVEGQFKRFGQDLKIDSGKFIFAGPLNNPNLDITASRKIKDITAGIEIFGTAKHPQSRVFSDPSMSESNALSYLLTGKAADTATEAEGDSLAQAAVSLGLGQVGKGLGLKGIAIESTNEFESSATAVGAYLVPDLYVGYAFNLFERFNGVLLKYQLNDSFSLEAQSGSSQSLDLFYSIDK
ncbi:MAG: translocation/assembly module TamB domain-containing protein, partial [Gammaproteobacteria bacterium]